MRQTAISHHASHVQVFNAEGMESARQAGRELMEHIASEVTDSGMQSCQPKFGLPAIGRTGSGNATADADG